MATTREADRYLYLTTPLGDDKLFLRGFTGHEALSQLFSFNLELFSENATTVDFDKLMGQPVSFGVLGAEARIQPRHFHGIITRFSQGGRNEDFTDYTATVEPLIWTLSRKSQSKIFQHKTIPDVLKKVLEGF